MDSINTVRAFYNSNAEKEWNRIANRPEFILTCRYLDRLIQPGERVLDIGGGSGRYAMHLAKRGCNVTLVDLSEANVAFALAKSQELQLPIEAHCGNALDIENIVAKPYDHVLLMGPLYHLLEESDRTACVHAAISMLKPGGGLFASFINLYSGMIYAMVFDPAVVVNEAEALYNHAMRQGTSFAGQAFTQAFFIHQKEVEPFMEQFPLEKLHYFGQEGILSPREADIMSQPAEVVSAWIDLAELLCEQDIFLSWAEHLMYIGRKK